MKINFYNFIFKLLNIYVKYDIKVSARLFSRKLFAYKIWWKTIFLISFFILLCYKIRLKHIKSILILVYMYICISQPCFFVLNNFLYCLILGGWDGFGIRSVFEQKTRKVSYVIFWGWYGGVGMSFSGEVGEEYPI